MYAEFEADRPGLEFYCHLTHLDDPEFREDCEKERTILPEAYIRSWLLSPCCFLAIFLAPNSSFSSNLPNHFTQVPVDPTGEQGSQQETLL